MVDPGSSKPVKEVKLKLEQSKALYGRDICSLCPVIKRLGGAGDLRAECVLLYVVGV